MPQASAPPLLRIEGLRKVYRRGLAKGHAALDGVDLRVEPGSVFGLLGPNGAGKTTLVKVCLGLVRGWSGTAEMLGRPAGHVRTRRRIGYLPEAHRLPPYLTGRRALELCGMLAGRDRAWLAPRAERWLERLAIADAADRKVREYSKGMLQRLGLAQALVHEPELVFLDEPTDGVDPVGRAVIREIVEEQRDRGVTVFINSHLLLEVEQICDRVVILARGKVVREGTVEELTPHTGVVTFRISPVPDHLDRILDGIGSNLSVGAHGFDLSVDDEGLDRAVDALRARGVGVRTISPRKLTLEQSFIASIREEGSGGTA